MKTVFIVNPKAGSGKNFNYLIDNIKKLCERTRLDIEIYITKAKNDGRLFVNNYCKTFGPARFIACGGDGTFNEVLNGAIGYDDAEFGIIPIGTGNDFCRNFTSDTNFFDLEKQIFGKCIKCDAIKYSSKVENKEKIGYCANMFNIGFDCMVADLTGTLKEKTIISGPFAYLASIFINLINKKTSFLNIEVDGEKEYSGELLLTSIANGSYCGGGLKTNPIAKINDGFININIVKNVSRLKFLKLLPKYIKGNYLNLKRIEKIVTSKKCKKVRISSEKKDIRLSIDGEIYDSKMTEFEIIHNAFSFVVPMDCITLEQEKTLIYNQ